MKKLFLVLLFVMGFGNQASADCKYIGYGKDLLDKADFIFTGRVINTNYNWLHYLRLSSYNYYTTFKVEEIIKGNIKDIASVHYGYYKDEHYGVSPEPYSDNKRFLIFALKDENGKMTFTQCVKQRVSLENLEKGVLLMNEYGILKSMVNNYPNIKEQSIKQIVAEKSSIK